jgi:hypothetical protein
MLPKARDDEHNAGENDQNAGEAVQVFVRYRFASRVDDQRCLRYDEAETKTRYAGPEPRQEGAIVGEFVVHDVLSSTR